MLQTAFNTKRDLPQKTAITLRKKRYAKCEAIGHLNEKDCLRQFNRVSTDLRKRNKQQATNIASSSIPHAAKPQRESKPVRIKTRISERRIEGMRDQPFPGKRTPDSRSHLLQKAF